MQYCLNVNFRKWLNLNNPNPNPNPLSLRWAPREARTTSTSPCWTTACARQPWKSRTSLRTPPQCTRRRCRSCYRVLFLAMIAWTTLQRRCFTMILSALCLEFYLILELFWAQTMWISSPPYRLIYRRRHSSLTKGKGGWRLRIGDEVDSLVILGVYPAQKCRFL